MTNSDGHSYMHYNANSYFSLPPPNAVMCYPPVALVTIIIISAHVMMCFCALCFFPTEVIY